MIAHHMDVLLTMRDMSPHNGWLVGQHNIEVEDLQDMMSHISKLCLGSWGLQSTRSTGVLGQHQPIQEWPKVPLFCQEQPGGLWLVWTFPQVAGRSWISQTPYNCCSPRAPGVGAFPGVSRSVQECSGVLIRPTGHGRKHARLLTLEWFRYSHS